MGTSSPSSLEEASQRITDRMGIPGEFLLARGTRPGWYGEAALSYDARAPLSRPARSRSAAVLHYGDLVEGTGMREVLTRVGRMIKTWAAQSHVL